MLTPTPNPLHDVHHEQGSAFSKLKNKLKAMGDASPLLRQIAGAGIGALVALVAYEGFAFASPYVAQMFTHDVVAEQQAIEEETQDAKMERIGALATEKLDAMRTSAPELFGNE